MARQTEPKPTSTPVAKSSHKRKNGVVASAVKTPLARRDHIKFNDEVFDTPATGYVTAEEQLSSPESVKADESSDDEAPEDVSFVGMRDVAVSEARARQKEVETMRERLREERRANDDRVRAQKEASKARKLKAAEKRANTDIPLFLPSSVLREVTTTPAIGTGQDNDEVAAPKRRKIIFSEPEKRDILKGDVTVRVLRSQPSTIPPPAKTQLLRTRDKWLNRKSVRGAKHGKIVI